MDSINLTVKQKAFADNYIKTGNATQSYIDAGYKCSSRNVAEANSSTLLGNHKVIDYLDRVNKAIQSDKIASLTEVKEYWTTTMRDEQEDSMNRLKASDYLAKTNNGFIDKAEQDTKLDNIKANTEFIKERTKLLKGATKDTSILDALNKLMNEE